MGTSFHSQVQIMMSMAEQFTKIAKSNMAGREEIASLVQLGDIFEDDTEIFNQFPEIKGGSQECMITPWSLNDPLKAAFKFLYSFKVKKVDAEIKKLHHKLEMQFAVMLCICCMAAGAGGSLAGWSSFEMAQITLQIVMAVGVMKVIWEMQIFKVLAGSSYEIVEHLRYISCKAGGNQVSQLMNIFEKDLFFFHG